MKAGIAFNLIDGLRHGRAPDPRRQPISDSIRTRTMRSVVPAMLTLSITPELRIFGRLDLSY
jgi:hypothetical protein